MTRVFFYVQHLYGVGHLRRAAAIVKELTAQHFQVRLVSGGFSVPRYSASDIRRPAATASLRSSRTSRPKC